MKQAKRVASPEASKCTQYIIHYGSHETINNSNPNIISFHYLPMLNMLLVQDIFQYQLVDLNTKSVTKRVMRQDTHVHMCFSEKDNACIFLNRHNNFYTLEKVDVASNEKIWICKIDDEKSPFPSYMSFNPLLDMVFVWNFQNDLQGGCIKWKIVG